MRQAHEDGDNANDSLETAHKHPLVKELHLDRIPLLRSGAPLGSSFPSPRHHRLRALQMESEMNNGQYLADTGPIGGQSEPHEDAAIVPDSPSADAIQRPVTVSPPLSSVFSEPTLNYTHSVQLGRHVTGISDEKEKLALCLVASKSCFLGNLTHCYR